MAFKTLLVHVENTPEAEARIGMAVELAVQWSAHLIGVGGCVPANVQQPFVDSMDGETLQIIDDLRRQDLEGAAARFHRLATPLGEASVWRSGEVYPDEVAVGFAAGADLIVAGCAFGPPASTLGSGGVTLHAGIPLLALPAACSTLRLQQVIVAWKNTREARRAVTDALPLLQAARGVHVVEIRGETDEVDPWGGLTGVVDRLAAHGVAATSERCRRGGFEDAEALIACARRRETDLIVAGAYGHSRLREWSFGGMTRDLMQQTPYPVLFSH